MLGGMLARGELRNPHNIRAGFKACGIYPLDMGKVLARLPPERTAAEVRREIQDGLAAQLERVRYGEQKKLTRAKKANRLPPGTAYTVSAAPPPDEEEAGEYLGTYNILRSAIFVYFNFDRWYVSDTVELLKESL